MLKTSHRLLLLQVALIIPIILGTYLLVAEKNQLIRFNEKQIIGMNYLQTVRGILQYIAEHRGMNSAYLNGDNSMRSRMDAKQQQIGQTIEQVNVIDNQYGTILLTGRQWNIIKDQWLSIKDTLAGLDKTGSFNQHTALIKEVINLFQQVGYNSNILLNPNLDTHYLAKISMLDLPMLLESLGQLRAIGSGIAASKSITNAQKIQMLSLLSVIRPMLFNLNQDIEKTLIHHVNLRNKLQDPINDFIKNSTEFANFLEKQVIDAEEITVSASELFDKATRAIVSGFDSYNLVVPVLSDLVQKRADDARFNRNVVIGIVLFSILLAVSLSLWVSRSIINCLGGEPIEMAEIAGQIAQGNLRAVPLHDDAAIGLYSRLLAMNAQLTDIVRPARETSELVDKAANEIAQGSADLAQRTEEQAAALEETAASLEQLTVAVASSADNAEHANQVASAARQQAEQSGEIVDRAMHAMSAILQSSQKIADIIGAIDEIAFQTNLLALNAAVEAARAGREGAGFAVVAAEVRKLAQRSANAAKEIKALIADSVHEVEEGNRQVEQSGKALKGIVNAVREVSDIIAAIATTAHEQANGLEQVNKAVIQMDQVTQQNAALVEETSVASQSMSAKAHELQELMAVFHLDEEAMRH